MAYDPVFETRFYQVPHTREETGSICFIKPTDIGEGRYQVAVCFRGVAAFDDVTFELHLIKAS